MAVDLHTHTTHSDGTYSPDELIKLAIETKLSAIAITDHDITSANDLAIRAARNANIYVIPGVEISVEYPLPHNGHLHLLGLFIDSKNSRLISALINIRNERQIRNKNIISRLNELNCPITFDELLNEAGEGAVGRPHFARLMVKKGYVKNTNEAFREYLKKGASAYVERVRFTIQQAIELIHQAGGLSILAHPVSLHYPNYEETGKEILKFKDMGLNGIEVYYPAHNEYFTNWLKSFALQNHLAISGGSDFHGELKSGIQLGAGRGDLSVPDEVFWNLKEIWEKGID